MSRTADFEAASGLLRASPKVKETALVHAGAGLAPILAVLAEPAWLETELQASQRASQRTLRNWEAIYDSTYRKATDHVEPDFSVWISTFTRQPIPLADMQAWLEAISARILELPHERMLEIGCGTGLVLKMVGPHCRSYRGTDISNAAVAQAQAWLAQRPDLAHAQVTRGAAHEVASDEPVDLVIINSVIQHFPDAAYLTEVMERAWGLLRPGGHIVIGDVRWKSPLPSFLSAVEVAKAEPDASCGAVRQAVARAWASQSELVVDPALFEAFAHGKGGEVACRLKSGRSLCEMTRYRYDVTLRKPDGGTKAATAAPDILEDAVALRAWLECPSPAGAVLHDVANLRLAADNNVHARLAAAAAEAEVASLRKAVLPPDVGTDPAALEEMVAAAGLCCTIVPQSASAEGRYEVRVHRGARSFVPPPVLPSASHSNSPLLLHTLRRLSVELYKLLAETLPEAEMPCSVIVVDGQDWRPLGWSLN